MFALLVISACGCASAKKAEGNAAAAGTSAAPSSAGRQNRNVITAQELSAPGLRALSVLEAIRQLRPQYLSVRGKNSQSDPEAGRVHASLDYGTIVPVDDLSQMHVNAIVEIRFLDAGAAMQKFGGRAHEGPVIVVITH
jgi:hypothetical protein